MKIGAKYDNLKSENARLLERIEQDGLKIDDLKYQLVNLTRVVFGSKSEKSPRQENKDQLNLFDVEVKEDDDKEAQENTGDKLEEATDDVALESSDKAPVAKKKRSRRKPTIELEVEEMTLEPTEEDRKDDDGNDLAVIGYEYTERLNKIPAKITRLVIKRPIMGYKDTRERFKALPYKSIISKGVLSDDFIHEIIHDKYVMALPLYRQLKEINNSGANISSSTISDAVKGFASFYSGVYGSVCKEAFSEVFVHADESPISSLKNKVIKNADESEVVKKMYSNGYFWVFKNSSACFFHYGATRSHQELKTVFDLADKATSSLQNIKLERPKGESLGYMMIDGYSAYKKAISEGICDVIPMACWAHARRKFEPLAKSGHSVAKGIFDAINRLYMVERDIKKESKKQKLNRRQKIDLTYKWRQEISKDRMKILWGLIDDASIKATPGTALHKSLGYVQKLREDLQVYLSDGVLPIDNNMAENAIRPMVIGRKNYLFVGSEDAGLWAATAYTIVESCRLVCIDFRSYLAYVTKELHSGRKDFENLTPLALKKDIKKVAEAG